MVNFSGLKSVSDWDVMQIKRLTGDWVKKFSHYIDLEKLEISVKKIHTDNKFKIDVRIHDRRDYVKKTKDKKVVAQDKLVVSAEGFGIVPVATDAFQKLERKLSQSKATH